MDFDIKSKITSLLMLFLLVVLLFTWFWPTLNGTSGINNTTTLWLGGVNYTWFVPVLIVIILIVVIMWVLGLI
jgi:hypothetical protein